MTKTHKGVALVTGLYYTLTTEDGEVNTAYFYSNPDYHMDPNKPIPEGVDLSELGFGFNTADGGSFLPLSHLALESKVSMTFGQAIQAMKKGFKVSRRGWNGKGMWCIYNPGSKGKTHAMFDGSVYKSHGVDECEILPHFDMYTVNADGRRAMLPGWLASQSDMDADDWGVVVDGNN